MRFGTRRLYLKLYLAFLGVLISIALVSAGVAALLGRGAWQILRQGPRIAGHLSHALPGPEDPAALAKAVDDANEELGLDVAVVDGEGEVLAAAGQRILNPGEAALARVGRFPSWVAPGVVGALLHHTGPGHTGPDRALVLVRVPVPEGALRAWPLRAVLLIMGTLLITAALLYPLSRSITAPLEQLTAATEAFGRGEVAARSGIDADDEVGRVARAFDRMAERIQAARRAEKELLANVSHELRTPLARIKVAMELIEPMPGPAGEALRKRLQAVGDEVDELSQLVSDVLTASKLDLAALPLRKETLLVRKLLEKSRERALALSPAPEVVIEAPADLQLVADEALLSRAVDNLIDNARKYAVTPISSPPVAPAPVRVEARSENGKLVLSVSDGGPGFPPDDLPRVFDPFFRGSNARGQAAGYGLGLALARRVAEAHGGTISAENLSPTGARITLTLPKTV